MRITSLAVATAALVLATSPASALSTSYGVDIYMSSPTVQATAVTNGVTAESFNAISAGACPATIAVGTVAGDCRVDPVEGHGGASANANDPSPTTGGVGSNFATTAFPTVEFVVTLNEPAKYLGFWWSAGSSDNSIELYSEGELVAFMTTDAILELLGEPTIDTVGGPSVTTENYFGNPRDNSLSPAEPFLYLNLYATGGAAFDEIKFMGGGFEFDNIAVSDLSQTPGSTEVAVEFIAGENDPAASNGEPLANTGSNATNLLGLGLAAVSLTIAAIALRRKRAFL